MIIGGLEKFSLLDYPGKISIIVFTQGCNFYCQFCYNPILVAPVLRGNLKYAELNNNQRQKDRFKYKENDFFVFLESRIGKVDAVVITGGEPTIHKDLIDFIVKIKRMGFLVKLDTNGSNPDVLKKLINKKLLDYIAMDIKSPKEKYQQVVGARIDWEKIEKSIKIIMASGLLYEFKTTIVPELFVQEDVLAIGKLINGADKWYLQKFKSNIELINQKLENKKSYSNKEMKKISEIGKKYVKICEAR